jgi:hypothetical protein
MKVNMSAVERLQIPTVNGHFVEDTVQCKLLVFSPKELLMHDKALLHDFG